MNAGPVTTFQQYAVVSESRVFTTGSSALTDMHVLMGCAAPTGMGNEAGCGAEDGPRSHLALRSARHAAALEQGAEIAQ